MPSPDGRDRSGVYHAFWLTLYEHTGTHFDAPPHIIPPSKSGLPHANEWGDVYGDMVPLSKLQGPAAVVDCRSVRQAPQQNGVSPLINVDLLQAWEAQHGAFQPGDAVLLQTGWDELYRPYPHHDGYVTDPFQGRAPGWPAPSEEAVVYLADKGIQLLATDTPSLGAADDNYTTHYAGLGRGMAFVECLTNLDQLPPRGAYFLFLAPKIARSTGCTGRAMAWIPGDAPESA
jgi:kynurenine formamidase